jgi:hypothetical protein
VEVLQGQESIDAALRETKILHPPEIVAVHDAWHAVVARVLGLVCGDAFIEGDEEGNSGVSFSRWDDTRKSRPERYGRDAEAMTAMAGTETELELLGNSCDGDWHDRIKISQNDPHASQKAPCQDRTRGVGAASLWQADCRRNRYHRWAHG